MPVREDARSTTYRFRRSANRWWLAGCCGVFALVGFSQLGESAYEGGYYASDSAYVTGSRIAYGLLAISALVLMVGILRMGIIADPNTLLVRNLVKRHALRWDEIESFRRPAPYGRYRRFGVQIVLRSGQVVYGSLYGAGPFNRPSFADDVIHKLEALRREFSSKDADR